MRDFNSAAYKRSRAAYVARDTADYFVAMLAGDAFLAKLLTYVGMSDALIGIVASFTNLAFIIQFLSIYLARVHVSAKKLSMIFDTVSIFFFMAMYLIPFLPVEQSVKSWLIVLSIIFAYIFRYTISSILYKWANSFVEPHHRGIYASIKEMISLITGIIFTMTVGYVIDRYEGLGNLEGAFLFITSAILILNITNFVSLVLIKKEEVPEDHNVTLKEAATNTLGNKNFRNVIILTILWDIAKCTTVGFMGVYKTNDLVMSVFLIQVVNMIGNFSRMLISIPMGKFSDRTSYAKGFRFALCLSAASFLATVFTTPKTWFFIIINSILFNCSYAGINQNTFNITYSYVDSKYITQAMAIKNCIGGIFGFGATIIASRILQAVQDNGNMVFGFQVYGQQILAGISFVLTIVTILFLRNVIEKQEVKIQ